MKISDEIRRRFNDGPEVEYVTFDRGVCDKMRELADRIDAEMVELPKDADGEPIHVGDLVWLDDRRMACVTEIDIKDGCEVIDCWDGSKHVAYHKSCISRCCHDSLERIADDIEESWGTVFIDDSTLCGWADRIRKLAEKEQGDE